MIIIHFPKYLRELTNGVESQEFNTTDFKTIIDGLRVLFPKLSLYLSEIDSRNITNLCYFISKENKKILKYNATKPLVEEEMVLLITLYGQGDDALSIVAGAALIAAGFFLGPGVSAIGVSGLLTGSQFITIGIGLTLTGVLSLFRPKSETAPTAAMDNPVRRDNDMFGSLKNTTSSDTSVPLVFGLFRVPGQFISGRVKTINHDASSFIRVSSYI